MTLRHLRIFVAVCTWGSITRAAEKLHMAQPSVSLAIRELEEYYQLQLFDRISRKLYLTGDGERFLKYASHITSLFDEKWNTGVIWKACPSARVLPLPTVCFVNACTAISWSIRSGRYRFSLKIP